MGAVGGILGTAGGINGSGFNTTNGTSAGQLDTAYNQNQDALKGQGDLLAAIKAQGGLQKQNDVYGQQQGIVSGQGPNPAQTMLQQATGQNVANQAALMAGQRGSGQNVGLMARQAAQSGANIQQQAAGQGATMQAQQSLNALNNAGAMATGMANNQIGQTNANTTATQNEQNILQGANTANNQVQGQLANTSMQGQQAVAGGMMQGASSMMKMMGGMAEGGEIAPQPSAFGGQSMFAQSLAPVMEPGPVNFIPDSGAAALEAGFAGKSGVSGSPGGGGGGGAGGGFGGQGGAKVSPMAKGGEVKAMVSPGEKVLNPSQAQSVARGKVNPMKVGGQVPGQAKVKGDSYKNDIIPAKLPAGGVVIPRSVMQSKDPVRGAADFVRAALAKKKAK